MKKYNRDGIITAYFVLFVVLGTYLASHSSTLQGFLSTLILFSIFGIGGVIILLKQIKEDKRQKVNDVE